MEPLRLICMDADAMPLFGPMRGGARPGYEPEVAELLAAVLGRPLVWVLSPWAGFADALDAGAGDAVLCGQGITDARRERVDFTRPYAVFDESVIVRAGSGIASAADLAGRRVGAIAGSTNMALAETFAGAERVPFGGATDDVFGEMLDALRDGGVDAVVDDDVALLPLAGDPAFDIAFTVATRNEWGLAVAKARPAWRDELDGALSTLVADGRLETAWTRWMPELAFPFGDDRRDAAT
ncbi:MAG: polar amino acid transport system substrate-binding protein [Solirubrobacteraceae bacterium]|jgi:polar amino acid transport system substrate-binding protein|nr:polar amino acid transport system substrate-binding protein [Solirubrobacteraceae bacterium]